MTFKSYFDSSEPIFKDLKILNLFKINTYLTSLFMIRYFYIQNLPEIFENMSNREIHNYNTRNSSLQHKTSNRTNYIENTFLLIKELKFGTIFPNNTKNLDPTVLLNQF